VLSGFTPKNINPGERARMAKMTREYGGVLRRNVDGEAFSIELETSAVLDHLLRTYESMADDDLHQIARIDSDGRIFWDGLGPGQGPQIANLKGLIFSALRDFDEWPASAFKLAELLEEYAREIRAVAEPESQGPSDGAQRGP